MCGGFNTETLQNGKQQDKLSWRSNSVRSPHPVEEDEEIKQLCEQLLKTVKHLEDNLANCRKQEEISCCEIVEVKAKPCTCETLCEKKRFEGTELKKSFQSFLPTSMDANITNKLQETEADKMSSDANFAERKKTKTRKRGQR